MKTPFWPAYKGRRCESHVGELIRTGRGGYFEKGMQSFAGGSRSAGCAIRWICAVVDQDAVL